MSRNRGSLLFETFVALMILSIGITSSLRVFGEALFINTRNRQKQAAKAGIDHVLFSWFANPNVQTLPDGGSLTLPLGPENSAGDLWMTVRSRNLSAGETASQGEKQIAALRENQFYEVEITAQKNEGAGILDLNTVIFQSKKKA